MGNKISSVRFEGEEASESPHHSLSVYLGREVEDIPQIGDEAFRYCESLEKLVLGDHFVKIGNKAMPFNQKTSVGYLPLRYQLHIPKQLQSVGENVFHNAYIDTLIYPDDLSEALCRRRINVNEIQHLIIRDIGELKNYTYFLSQGSAPDEYPEKCLYHLMRCARHIYFAEALDEIFDAMFEGCGKLFSIDVGSEITNEYLKGFRIPRGIHSIGNRAFADCSLLQPIQYYEDVKHIGDNAFPSSKAPQKKESPQKKEPQVLLRKPIPTFSVDPVLKDLDIFDTPSIPLYEPSPSSYESSSYSYEPMLDEDDRILSEIASDSRGDVTYTGFGDCTATDIEGEWSDLDSIGFWDDKEWQ